MTEQDVERREVEKADPELMQTIVTNLEYSVHNVHLLDDVLKEEDLRNRGIMIEGRSTSLDLGGFFIDEPNSDPRYRHEMFTGPNGGDTLRGVVQELVVRESDGRKEAQIQVDVGYVNDPITCFFKLTDMLEGCRVTRL
jgi:hypothetical protein